MRFVMCINLSYDIDYIPCINYDCSYFFFNKKVCNYTWSILSFLNFFGKFVDQDVYLFEKQN